MNGETEGDAGWTVGAIRYHFQQQLDDLIRMLDERDAARTKAVDTALTAADKALNARTETLDKEFHEHLEQVRHENALALSNMEKQNAAQFAASEKAIDKSDAGTEKRFESVNEFRGQLADQARQFLPRAEYDANHKALEQRVSEITDRQNRAEGKSSGTTTTFGIMLTVAAVAISVIVVFINILVK